MSSLFDRLVPRPKRVACADGMFFADEPDAACFVGGDETIRPAMTRLRAALNPAWRIEAGPDKEAVIRFRLVGRVAGPQSYRLTIGSDRVSAEAEDGVGLFYAAVTLAQLIRLSAGRLPAGQIEDAPDFPVRGVMLDISRDKVPTMETLFRLTDRLADLKINQLQLYTEHAFAYRGHEDVWRTASPMTPEDVRALDAYCKKRCVELVPNQNSFGHLERWLTLPRYQELAELPQGGAPLPWGGVQEKPSSLCPTDPRSVTFLAGLYDELLPNFTSGLFNVGCDETFDLQGNGRSREAVRKQGEGRVYLDFLKKVHRLVSARGRRMLFWGDIIIRHPELIAELPRGVTALEWGYEADHPFDAHGAQFAASGVPFYVCPGTSSWNSLSGRSSNMQANLTAAAENGMRHGACGYLITDWGDGGHWQPLAVSFAGFVYGACVSWGLAENRERELAEAMDDGGMTEGLGGVLLGLGDVYRLCGALRSNGTELFQILFKPCTRPLSEGVSVESLRQVLARVDELSAAVPGGQTVLAQETRQVVRLLQAACHRGLALAEGGIGRDEIRCALMSETDELANAHAAVWRLRNREGGLKDSLARLDSLRTEYAVEDGVQQG